MKNLLLVTFLIFLAGCSSLFGTEPQVGQVINGAYVVATKQLIRPAGKSVDFGARPVDLVLSPDGKTIYVMSNIGLHVIDAASMNLKQSLGTEGGSYHGIVVTRDGSKIYMSTAKTTLQEIFVLADGKVSLGRKISITTPDDKSHATPCGIVLSKDEKLAYVCLSRNNSLGVVDLISGKLVREIPVGVAPYGVVLSPDEKTAWVSNWGGRHPREGERSDNSGGTQALTDSRAIAASGTVSVVDLIQNKEITQIATGLHPSALALDAKANTLYVANANSDTLSVINTRTSKVIRSINVKPVKSLPFGSAPNAISIGKDGKTIFVANGCNNAIAVINNGNATGFIPTGWYPGGVVTDGKYLYIANIKGYGTRDEAKKSDSGWQIYNPLGTVQKVAIPDTKQLAAYSKQVRNDARIPQVLRAQERAKTGVKPAVVPEHVGEPSPIDHIVYIIKENKTYDQVYGDMPRGNSDPKLCIFGRNITPNQHALADQFALLDNYYCNGVCSADGHQWTTEGYATDYLEKAFGGWPRSYPFAGDDPLAYSSGGFIWDNALLHGLSFRNYGEMGKVTGDVGTYAENYQRHLKGATEYPFKPTFDIDTLERYSNSQYPGWTLNVPDQVRADIFLRDFAKYEKDGNFPNLVTIHLPVNHTVGLTPGYPTPKQYLADNDLAVGRVVEAISKSKFWPNTCIFIIEDDPQSGYDHVDGHRSSCLVISPYTKHGAVVSQFYNQTSVLHTMELMLGLPPMNQMDAMAPVMSDCFMEKPDLSPYTAVPSNVPWDEINPKKEAMSGETLYWAMKSLEQPFDAPDKADDDVMNRVIWYAAKGPGNPYPVAFAGAHGKGLKALHLALSPDDEEDDDD